MKTTKLAMAVLALSLTHSVNASEGQNAVLNETDSVTQENSGTYWGVGIGSVLGAVIAGPPGAAIGATLGGSIGWGQDKDAELDQSLLELEQGELALQQHQDALMLKNARLNSAHNKLSQLNRENARQATRLTELMTQNEQPDVIGNGVQSNTVQSNTALRELITYFSQEIYFRYGESSVPAYAQARLDNLSAFLKTHPQLNISLKGYTDSQGSSDFNAALAQARVEGVKAVLLAQGIDAQRLTLEAVGEAETLSQERDGSKDVGNYVLDRRVSIVLSMDETEISETEVSEIKAPAIASVVEVSL